MCLSFNVHPAVVHEPQVKDSGLLDLKNSLWFPEVSAFSYYVIILCSLYFKSGPGFEGISFEQEVTIYPSRSLSLRMRPAGRSYLLNIHSILLADIGCVVGQGCHCPTWCRALGRSRAAPEAWFDE